MNKLVKYIIESRYNFNIDQLDIEDNEEEFSLSKQKYKSKSMKEEYLESLFIDLGLPSGTKWCKYNLGCNFTLLNSNPEATSPRDWYGKYYAWGETKDKDNYLWDSYKYAKNSRYKLTKYCTDFVYGYNGFTDDLSELLLEDDAAYQYNSDWRMPTKKQYQELINYTDNRHITGKGNDLYMNVNDLVGRLFISKINGNQIFIPAAGYKYKSSLHSDGSFGGLWSSNLYTNQSGSAWGLFIYPNSIYMNFGGRSDGRSVRPVLNKNN